MPMPGATRMGLRAYSAMARLLRKLMTTVADSAAEKGMPASDNTAGLTTMMYMPARKVAIPASSSVFSELPRRLTLK